MNKVTVKEKIQYILIQIIKILLCLVFIWLMAKYLFWPSVELFLETKNNTKFTDIATSVISFVLFLILGVPLTKMVHDYIKKILLSFLPYYHVKNDKGDDIILGQKQYNNYIKRSKRHEEEKNQQN